MTDIDTEERWYKLGVEKGLDDAWWIAIKAANDHRDASWVCTEIHRALKAAAAVNTPSLDNPPPILPAPTPARAIDVSEIRKNNNGA